MIEDGDRPRIAKTMGRSRFPKNRCDLVRIRAANFGPWQVEHLQRQKCCFRHDNPAAAQRDWIMRSRGEGGAALRY